MTAATGTLTLFCGKMGAGKSTRAETLARESGAVLLSEDVWLADLYPGQIASLDDYVRCSSLLKPPIKRLVQSILRAGTDVVMDFPANTRAQRAWLKALSDETGAPHRLIVIEVPDAVCLARIARRRTERPERAATDTAEMFAQLTQYFAPPAADEAFHVVRVSDGG